LILIKATENCVKATSAKNFSRKRAPKNHFERRERKKIHSDIHQKAIFKRRCSKKSSKRLKPKNHFHSDKSQKYFQYNKNQKNISTATSVKKNSLIDQRYKIFKGTSAKKHFQMDNCQKSFSKRKDRQAPQNHFQSERHQIRFQNDKCQKILSKIQTENFFWDDKSQQALFERTSVKKFKETSAKKI